MERRPLLASLGLSLSAGCLRFENTSQTPADQSSSQQDSTDVARTTTAGPSSWPQPRFDGGKTGSAPDITPLRDLDSPNQTTLATDEISELTYSEETVCATTGQNERGVVIALDSQSLKEQWRQDGDNLRAPVIYDGAVYLGRSGQGVGLSAYDLGSGDPLFERDGEAGEPTLYDGTLYATTEDSAGDTRVGAFDPATGDLRWTSDPFELMYSPPVVTKGGLFAQTQSDEAMVTFGLPGQTFDVRSLVEGTFAGLAADEGVIYAGGYQTGTSGTLVAKPIPDTGSDISWERDLRITERPTVGEEHVYALSGQTVYAVDKRDGTTQWSADIPGPPGVLPIEVGDVVYTFGDSTVRVLERDATVVSSVDLPDAGTEATSAFATDEALVVAAGSTLYKFGQL